MTTEEKVFEALEMSGLNWTVQKKALVSVDGDTSESFGIYKGGNKWLGTVGPIYQPFQNHELATVMVEATAEIGLSVSRGGMLKDGKLVYLQTELPDTVVGKSNLKRWITGLTSHDGTCGIGLGSTNQVVTCQNIFYKAYGEIQKFRHSVSAKERLQIALKELKTALHLDEILMENFRAMQANPLEEEVFANILKKAFNSDVNMKRKDISTRKANQLDALSRAIEVEVAENGPNLWSLFNGITRYTNHTAAKPGKREEYLMAGGGYQTNLITYNEIMSWMADKTEAPELILN